MLVARYAYADTRRASVDDVEEKVLLAGAYDGRRYLLGQFWLRGDDEADTFGVVVGEGPDVEPQLYRPLPADPAVVAMHLSPTTPGAPGGLVVAPRPGGEVSYSPTAEGPFSFAGTGDARSAGATVVQRPDAAEREGRDRVKVDAGSFSYTVDVFQLLCGKTSCG